MKTIYISNSDIIKCVNFAQYTVSQHYRRMWQNEDDGILKIISGKLGELAVTRYCEMLGIRLQPNFCIGEGVDITDLIIHKKNVAVKSKNFKRMALPPLHEIWLHVPVDQYLRLIKHNTTAIIAVCVHTKNKNKQEWLLSSFCTTSIVGGLLLEDYDKNKILQKAGEEIAPGFRLPHPDSWAVSWAEMEDFDSILLKIK